MKTERRSSSVTPLARQDIVLVGAIAVTGIAAARAVGPALLAATAIVGMGVLRMARQRASAALIDDADVLITSNFPRELDYVVGAVMDELADGQARLLLGAIIQQADLVLAPRESAFDDGQDRETKRHVIELVTAACATARELANLDASRTTLGASMATPTGAQLELTARLDSARTLMANRLTDATDALQALYAAGVERGTPASDRVAELASELRGDATARRNALTELATLLDTTRQTS
jgi:hypothetical protein